MCKYLLSLLTILLLLNCKSEDEGNPEITENNKTLQLSELYDNEISVLNNLFIIEVSQLQLMVNSFKNENTEVNLIAIQKQWKKTILIWKRTELFAIRNLSKQNFKSQIHNWPADQDRINTFLETASTINPTAIEQLGANVKGLAAIEFLIFDKPLNILNSPKIINYLVETTNDIATKSILYKEAWEAFEVTFKTNTETSTQGSQNLLYNAIVFKIEEIRKNKIGNPTGNTSGNDPNIEFAEAYFSEQSLDIIIQEIKEIERLFTGNYETKLESIGFYSQLENLDRPDLITKLQKQFITIDTKTKAIAPTLEQQLLNNKTPVLELFDEIDTLVTLVKVDVSSTLGIIVTFNDNDGD